MLSNPLIEQGSFKMDDSYHNIINERNEIIEALDGCAMNGKKLSEEAKVGLLIGDIDIYEEIERWYERRSKDIHPLSQMELTHLRVFHATWSRLIKHDQYLLNEAVSQKLCEIGATRLREINSELPLVSLREVEDDFTLVDCFV